MALFSKRHYDALAAELAFQATIICNNQCKFTWIVERLADRLASDNPKFDRQRFLVAIFPGGIE